MDQARRDVLPVSPPLFRGVAVNNPVLLLRIASFLPNLLQDLDHGLLRPPGLGERLRVVVLASWLEDISYLRVIGSLWPFKVSNLELLSNPKR